MSPQPDQKTHFRTTLLITLQFVSAAVFRRNGIVRKIQIITEEEKEGRLFVWQGYTGKVELISFKTFLTKQVRRVALGGEHSLFLTYDNCLYSCGSNEYGELGVPSFEGDYSFDPLLLESLTGKNVTEIACGQNHCGAVCDNGQIYCWGSSEQGQCGLGTEDKKISSPELVRLFTPTSVCQHGVEAPEREYEAEQVSCGATHSIAASTDGNVWVWGSGVQLGLGEARKSLTPVIVTAFKSKNVLKVLCGDYHSVVITEQSEPDNVQNKSKDKNRKVSASKEPPSPCVECNKLLGYEENEQEVDNEGEADTFVYDPCDTAAGNVRTSVNIIDNHFGDNTEVKLEAVVDDGKTEDKSEESSNVIQVNNLMKEQSDIKEHTDTETEETSVKSTNNEIVTETEHKYETNNGSISFEASGGDPLGVTGNTDTCLSADSRGDTKPKEFASLDVDSLVEVELRSKTSNGDQTAGDKDSVQELEHPLTQSVKSTTSVGSSGSSKSRTKAFLNEAETREFLAKQFEDDSGCFVEEPIKKPVDASTPKRVVPDETVKQSLDSFTSLMTTSLSSFTSKAFGNITSVFQMSDDPESPSTKKAKEEKDEKAETVKTEVVWRRADSPDLDETAQEMSSMGDITTNVSLMSIPEAETSLQGEATPEASPLKKKGEAVEMRETKKKVAHSSQVSVSKQPQSIRTIEAKQEQLRKRSLNFPTAEEESEVKTSRISMETEIWTWGLNAKGQLGLGDMIERSEPVCIQFLTGKRIIKVATGSQHTLALTSTGQVYSWGLNLSGQLGHSEMSSVPAAIPLNSECVIWDIGAGSNHSIFLMDHGDMKDSRPDVFYVGKHPCKDLYVPIYKTQRLTRLKFMKQAGWVRSLTTGGDNCSCLSRKESAMTTVTFDFSQYLRRIYLHQHKVIHEFIKRLQVAGFFTSLDVSPYKGMMGNIMTAFIELTRKLGDASIEVTELLCSGESIPSATFFTKYDNYISRYKKYSAALSEMEAVGGFEYAAKIGSATFDNLTEFYKSLLNQPKVEDRPDHAEKFRQIMNIPLTYLKDLSALISRFSDMYDGESPESNLLSSVHLNFEHLIRTSSTEVSNAENTRKFWETCTPKLAENWRSTSRRLIKESKTSPIVVTGTGRFSYHNFYLFNDILIHSHASSYQAFPLQTVWVDTPTEAAGNQNTLIITTPEEIFTVTAQTSGIKVDWMVALNSAINKTLPVQKALQHQTSSERINPPVIRQATHTFTKHTLYKDAKYDGYWLNGKPHGGGRLRWPDGKKYSGRFKHGMQFGFGKLTTPVGEGKLEIHDGNWKEGKLQGHGKIIYGNGDLYDGYFKEGQRHGHGFYRKGKNYNTAAFVYIGEWLNDRRHGYGVMDDILKGEKYMGMWQEDNRHGDGIVVTLDGMYFEGNFQHNKLIGFGLMLTDDNSCYEGEFSGITLLQGKGTLTFPSADKLEGMFSGTWNQGLKITGTFLKNNDPQPERRPANNIKSSLYGKLCVRPDRKWEEMFYQCYESLHYSGDGEPNTQKAWEQIAIIVTSCSKKMKEKMAESTTSKLRKQLSNLEKLEKIPPHGKDHLSIEHYAVIKEYLTLAFDTHFHPLGLLIEGLVDVFRGAYIGIGAHSRLLYHAVQEVKSFIKRIFATVRIIFPELPADGSSMQIYPESSRKASTPVSEEMGFLQRQISEVDEEEEREIVSPDGLLQPILLPKIFPALFDLYALHREKEDDKYWERVQKLNKQGDMSLMAYLGVDPQFWCIDNSLFKEEEHKRLSTLKDECFSNAVDVLQQISTAFCPLDKLEIIKKTFLSITQTVEEFSDEEHIWCMDDLFPIFQFVVVRAKIHHLGAEIHFIEELMESYLEFGELGIMFTTLKACYYQIQNEKIPIH